jgi:hypothetical protein
MMKKLLIMTMVLGLSTGVYAQEEDDALNRNMEVVSYGEDRMNPEETENAAEFLKEQIGQEQDKENIEQNTMEKKDPDIMNPFYMGS